MFDNVQNPSIKLDFSTLLNLLKCSFCNGIFRDPYTLTECAHTFCRSCIYRYFYNVKGSDKCPLCYKYVGGKPLDLLKPDNTIKELINIIFPEFEKKENSEVALFERLLARWRKSDKDSSFNNKSNTKLKDDQNYVEANIVPRENIYSNSLISFSNIKLSPLLSVKKLRLFLQNYCDQSDKDLKLSFSEIILEDEMTIDILVMFFGFGGEGNNVIKYTYNN